MKQAKLNSGLLLAALLSVTLLAIAPVSAQHGADDTTASPTPTTTTTTTSGATTHSGADDTTTEVEVHKGNDDAKARVTELRAQAKAKVATLRDGKTEKTAAQRQQLCVNRQKAVDNKLTAFSQAADKHLARLNGVFDKLQAYQTDKQLPVANYQTLVDAANAKKDTATQAVAALKTVSVNIDCSTSTDPASSLTVVKAAAKDARTALKDYRKSLKDIVVALAQSKGDSSVPTDTSTSPGGTN